MRGQRTQPPRRFSFNAEVATGAEITTAKSVSVCNVVDRYRLRALVSRGSFSAGDWIPIFVLLFREVLWGYCIDATGWANVPDGRRTRESSSVVLVIAHICVWGAFGGLGGREAPAQPPKSPSSHTCG